MVANAVREFFGNEPVILGGWPGSDVPGLVAYQRSIIYENDLVVYQTSSEGVIVPKRGVLEVDSMYGPKRRYLPGTRFWANIPTPEQTKGQTRSGQWRVMVEEPTMLQQLQRGYRLNARGQWEIPADIGKPLDAREMVQSLEAEKLIALAKDRQTTLEALLPEYVEAGIFVGRSGMADQQ